MSEFDYKNESTKISDEFKQRYSQPIHGVQTILSQGLTALGHLKKMWKLDVDVIQYPTKDNNWTCICKATVGGYGWDPVEEKICRVEFSDIGDANPNNCSKNVAPSYIRMASTRAVSRALRKYTNLDMVTADELSMENTFSEHIEYISAEQLSKIKKLLQPKGIDQNKFNELMLKLFNTTDHMSLTEQQGDSLITSLQSMPDVNNQSKD